MANIVDPEETAPNEPSHLGLHCLQRYDRAEGVKLSSERGFQLLR